MPVSINPLRSIQRQDNLELVSIEFIVKCDGTTNILAAIARRQRQVTRDQNGVEIEGGDTVCTQFKLSDFSGAQQTSLIQFMNGIDNK